MSLVTDFETHAPLHERTLSELVERAAGGAIRAWVPHCASGEDAYAIAMVLLAYLEANQLPNDVQIIGSDKDPAALATARAAVYSASARSEFAHAGLGRFFREEGTDCRVVKRVRDCVMFSAHDLDVDPPFPRQGLVFGGALFEDLTSESQAELLQVLHYALAPRGWLLLGTRRMPAGMSSLFSTIDAKAAIFQRRDEPSTLPASRLQKVTGSTRSAQKRASERPGVGGAVEGLILQNYAPACVVVDDQHRVVYRVGELRPYLQQPQGAPTQDVLRMARPELRPALRVLLQTPLSEGKPLRVESVELHEGHAMLPISIDAQALPAVNGGGALRALVFRERAASDRRIASRSASPRAAARRSSPPSQLAPFEPEPQSDEAQALNEGLVASNEELMSLNEELESAKDELLASREQLQSVNEEMETVNGELRAMVAEGDRLNNDLRNLIENTQIATLFLDGELRVRIFTPAARELFRLIPADCGRPLLDIAARFVFPELKAELSHVLRTRVVRETQVQTRSRWYVLRILPYLTLPGAVDGVVLTFTDITDVKLAHLEVKELGTALAKQVEWLRTLVNVVPVGISFHEFADGTLRVNRGAAELMKLPVTDDVDSHGLVLARQGSQNASPAERTLREAMTSPDVVDGLEVELEGAAEQRRHVLVHAAPLRDAQGEAYANVSALLDITDSKLTRERASARERQQAIVAELGLHALESENLDLFLTQCIQAIGEGADAELCDLARLSEDGRSLTQIAVWGFDEATLTEEAVEPGNSAQQALERREAVVLDASLAQAERWPSRLRREKVRVGARIAVRADLLEPFGLLGVYRRTAKGFSQQDLLFLRAIANVLTSAIHRQLIEQARLRDGQAAARRESERQMQRSERLASLGTFATGIAHELNNPLSNIVLSADYAAKTPDASRRDKMLEAIRENAMRCGRIVEGVLRFARDEVTEKWLNDLNPITRHAAQLVVSYVGPGKLKVLFEFAEPSPRLNCNPTELEQVFVNLLKNAAQAHPGQCVVRIRTSITGKEVLIEVEDDGPGIPAADLERIFDPFFSSQRAAGGTGLGLSITHHIVGTHGGSIRASNMAGGGARFELRLPLAQTAAPGNQHEVS